MQILSKRSWTEVANNDDRAGLYIPFLFSGNMKSLNLNGDGAGLYIPILFFGNIKSLNLI